MRIGDEIYIHGYVDEIRKDVVIVKNGGIMNVRYVGGKVLCLEMTIIALIAEQK